MQKMSHMSTSDKVAASREAKRLILAINERYKETKDETLMDLMKRLTVKKKKIEKKDWEAYQQSYSPKK